jgi:hypothetical protein
MRLRTGAAQVIEHPLAMRDLSLVEDSGINGLGMSERRPHARAAGVEGLDEARGRRIELARIRVALALRVGDQRHGADQERIQEMAEHRVDGILATPSP